MFINLKNGEVMSSSTFTTKIDQTLGCPISLEIMVDPLVAKCCGNSFERDVIITALAKKAICPMCNAKLTKEDLIPNLALRNIAEVLGKECPSPHRIFLSVLLGRGESIVPQEYQQAIEDSSDKDLEDFFSQYMTVEYPSAFIKERFITSFRGKIDDAQMRKIDDAFKEVRISKVCDKNFTLMAENKTLREEKDSFAKQVTTLQDSQSTTKAENQKKISELKVVNQGLQKKINKDKVAIDQGRIGTGAAAGAGVGLLCLGAATFPVSASATIVIGMVGGAIGTIAAQSSTKR